MQILVHTALCNNVNSKLSRVPELHVCVYIYIIYFLSFLSLSLCETGCGCEPEVSLEYLMEAMLASNSRCASECWKEGMSHRACLSVYCLNCVVLNLKQKTVLLTMLKLLKQMSPLS